MSTLEDQLQEREALDDLKFNLLKAHNNKKLYEDGMRRDVHYNVGDMVYLKLLPYRQKYLAKRPFEKLAAPFYGPFKILEKVGTVAYKM